MTKIEPLGVKHVAAVSRKRIRVPDSASGGIKGVSRQRVTGERKMNANLVRPSRFDPDLEE